MSKKYAIYFTIIMYFILALIFRKPEVILFLIIKFIYEDVLCILVCVFILGKLMGLR